jgi:tetratricopeptide (TPR) repeat protein
VADYYFREGKWQEAESAYQLCYQNTNRPASMLSYQARMMAGRAAFARQGWKDAIQYFTNLTSDLKCPADVWVQAMFAYGGTLMSQDSTNRTADLQTAIAIFGAISQKLTNQPQAALALGEKAKCLLQLAQNTSDYEPVTNAFEQVIRSPAADASARSIARVGLGLTLEKMADQASDADRAVLLEAALQNFLAVFYYEKLLRDGEKPDPFWTQKAGIEAAALLAEKLKRRPEAISLYRRLQEMFPPLRFEERINLLRAQEQEGAQKS